MAAKVMSLIIHDSADGIGLLWTKLRELKKNSLATWNYMLYNIKKER